MTEMTYGTIPGGLPVPEDDGAARHLLGLNLPDLTLLATDGSRVRMRDVGQPQAVIYAYPRTGVPGEPLPPGWDDIPGARGCTPENQGFCDLHEPFRAARTQVFGLSTQDTGYQQEMATRLGLPHPILSDFDLALTRALDLPSFRVDGLGTLLKRMTLVVRAGRIHHVFYPVFPPDTHGAEVLAWVQANPIA